ncbi:hypothetical protein [Archangium primigenium]|jgi:hypothetical protein|uniref:hypothetical protein n=1 Tax=Melittangium TaxID=44 RepID=UPI00195A7A60|nr:hypothetical protein [Archangium primigenium]MBM7114581.1 hypothetical protein [Archangium primigenium]
MSSEVSARSTTLRIEDTERKKVLGQPEPMKSDLVVFDPAADETGDADTVSEDPEAEPVPHH